MGKEIISINREAFSGSFFEPLLHINQKPKQLFYCGDIDAIKYHKKVCIVGSRAHSNYAKEVIDYLVSGLANQPIVIISGLALGIDGLAHKAALQHGLSTMAVTGSSLEENNIYPRAHAGLSQDIISAGGVLVSEYENQSATNWTFPARNRIMAGLADVVLVIEAAEKSGTLITAKLAADYNKELAVIPNSVFSEFSKGSNRLLKDGAHPVCSPNDILELLGLEQNINNQKIYDDVSAQEMKILDALSEPLDRKTLSSRLNIESSELSSLLSLLEIKDHIIESVGLIRKK